MASASRPKITASATLHPALASASLLLWPRPRLCGLVASLIYKKTLLYVQILVCPEYLRVQLQLRE